MLAGRAEEGRGLRSGAAAPAATSALHPSAEVFVNFKDFSFFRIRPTAPIWWPGLAASWNLKPERFLTDIPMRGRCWKPSRAPSTT